MLSDLILALGLLLSTATQLRPLAGVVGPGECLLLIWLLLATGRAINRTDLRPTPVLWTLVVFWIVFGLAEALGALVGMATEEIRDDPSMLHDALSYVLLAAVSCLSVAEPEAALRLRRTAWLFIVIGSLALLLIVANAIALITLPSVQPWFFERLQGWSENPNQLALLCAALGLLSLHLAETSIRKSAALLALLCCVLPVIVGRMTGSDTFIIIVVVTGPVFAALTLRSWLLPIEGRLTIRSAAAWLIVMAIPLLLVSTALVGTAVVIQTEDVATQVLKNGGKEREGKSKLRFALWDEAFNRGLNSGLMGLGPGAHLVSTPYKRVPPPNFEAHNTPLDLFTQGGVLAVGCFALLVGTAVVRSYRANLTGLTVLLGGLAVFSMFHLIVRHPTVWFVLALCLVTGTEQAAATLRRI